MGKMSRSSFLGNWRTGRRRVSWAVLCCSVEGHRKCFVQSRAEISLGRCRKLVENNTFTFGYINYLLEEVVVFYFMTDDQQTRQWKRCLLLMGWLWEEIMAWMIYQEECIYHMIQDQNPQAPPVSWSPLCNTQLDTFPSRRWTYNM